MFSKNICFVMSKCLYFLSAAQSFIALFCMSTYNVWVASKITLKLCYQIKIKHTTIFLAEIIIILIRWIISMNLWYQPLIWFFTSTHFTVNFTTHCFSPEQSCYHKIQEGKIITFCANKSLFSVTAYLTN